jgi:hypothetical protein
MLFAAHSKIKEIEAKNVHFHSANGWKKKQVRAVATTCFSYSIEKVSREL